MVQVKEVKVPFPVPVEKLVERKVPHPYPVVKEVRVPVFIPTLPKFHNQHKQSNNDNHENQDIFNDSFFAGSNKQTSKRIQKPKGNDDYLTPPPSHDDDTFRRNLNVNKSQKPKTFISQNHHRQVNQQNHQNTIQSKLPSNLEIPQPPSGFQLHKDQPQHHKEQPQHHEAFVQHNVVQSKPSSESFFIHDQHFPPHTPKPAQDLVTQASTQYETYSHHPQIQYVQQHSQQYFPPQQQSDIQQQIGFIQTSTPNSGYYSQQQQQETQYQIQYPQQQLQYVQYQQHPQQYEQQQSQQNDFQSNYGIASK